MRESKEQGQLEIQCPFFMGDEGKLADRRIPCESPVPGTHLSLYFPKKEDHLTQLRIFCCRHYEKCEIYRAVMEAKYE